MLRRLQDRFDAVGLNLPPKTRQRGIRRKMAIFIARLFLRAAQIISRDLQAEVYPYHEQDQRRRINLHVGDAIPDALDVPGEVTIVELSFSMESEKLPEGQEEALEALARSLRTRGVDLVLKVHLDQGNWIHLRSWLKHARSLDIAITPGLVMQSERGSLAHLDGDALACLHGIIFQWLREYPPHSDQATAHRMMDTVLTCLRGWQREAADRYPSRENLILPDREHSLLNDNGALERFLGELLRISDDVHIERWLTDIVQDQNFVEKARRWRSFRLIALWLICVFRRFETVSQLREILGERGNAHRILDHDSKALTGTSWKGWFDAWTDELRLRSSNGGEQRFVIGSALRETAGEIARITVIIPSYNHEAFIGDAIRSVLGQTRTDFQLLIVDDASQDGTVNEAEKIKDSRIRVRSNPENLGLGSSLARALDDVDTEFVALLNSDDLFHPLRLERCLAPLEENIELAMVATALSPLDSNRRILSATDSSPVFDGPQIYQWLRWYDEHASMNKPPSDLLGALLERNFLITTSNLVARTEFLRRHRESWQDLEFCVDWHIFLMAALDRKLRYLGDPLLGYRLHQTNTVWFDGERRWRYFLEVNQVMARILESLFQHYSASGAGLNDLLRNVSEHLSRNTNLDWAGVVVGLFSERLHLRPRDFEGSEQADAIKSLAAMRDQRVQIMAWYQEFGGDIRGLYRMRGEYPFLRTIRNQYEALRDDHSRLQLSSQHERGVLQGELRQRVVERDEQEELRQRIAERDK